MGDRYRYYEDEHHIIKSAQGDEHLFMGEQIQDELNTLSRQLDEARAEVERLRIGIFNAAALLSQIDCMDNPDILYDGISEPRDLLARLLIGADQASEEKKDNG